ncbi:MAG TPA: HDOD domain-containing protein [Phycisphaerales bacterium]|nr:HDOD domain-containing protein [Phycisphaerales bacterium]
MSNDRVKPTINDNHSDSDSLDQRIEALGLGARSQHLSRLLDLCGDPSASLMDFARLIRTDAALAGRLLKIANSVYYAQRGPVTNLDRACVLLGIERLKAFSLGFTLGQAAADRESEFSQRVWGESVFRACLAGELAREACPLFVTEAFIIGLMIDAGQGLMPKLLPGKYRPIAEASLPPAEVFEQELATLPFTHLDAIRSLSRLWKLPELLAEPVAHHHTTPPQDDPTAMGHLRRIAFVAGNTDCRGKLSPMETPPVFPARVEEILGLSTDRIAAAIRRAGTEYTAAATLFQGGCPSITDPADLCARVRHQLAQAIDHMLAHGGGASATVIERFLHDDVAIEVRRTSRNQWTAYLCDARGEHLAQVTFGLDSVRPRFISESLGLTPEEAPVVDQILAHLRARAA